MTTDRVKQLRDTADALEVSEWPGYAFTVREVAKELEALLTAKEELEATFDLRWKADMRAIQRWREAAPGRELTLPDHADLCVWLLEERDEQEKHIRLTEAILAVKQQELIAAGLFIIGCGYTGPLTEEAGKQFVSERDQLEKRAEALEEALKSQPCGCTCDYSKAADASAAEKRGDIRVACGDLPDEPHPNRVWCARCAALTTNVPKPEGRVPTKGEKITEKAVVPGTCFICAQRIYVSDVIICSQLGAMPVAAHAKCDPDFAIGGAANG